MAKFVKCDHIQYVPGFDPETDTYVDECPFELNKKGDTHVCPCRNRNDLFSNVSQFKLHTKAKHHTDWVKIYEKVHSPAEIKSMSKELKTLKKENAMLAVELDIQKRKLGSQILVAEKYKLKYKNMKKKFNEQQEIDTDNILYECD